MTEDNSLISKRLKIGSKLTELHSLIYHQVLFMIDDIQENGEQIIDDKRYYLIDCRTVDRLICAVKGIEYRGPK